MQTMAYMNQRGLPLDWPGSVLLISYSLRNCQGFCTHCSSLKHEQEMSPSLHPVAVLFSCQRRKWGVLLYVERESLVEWRGVGASYFERLTLAAWKCVKLFFLSLFHLAFFCSKTKVWKKWIFDLLKTITIKWDSTLCLSQNKFNCRKFSVNII